MEDADAEALGTPQGDGHVLMRAGVLETTADGGVIFPYDAIHVDFLLKVA